MGVREASSYPCRSFNLTGDPRAPKPAKMAKPWHACEHCSECTVVSYLSTRERLAPTAAANSAQTPRGRTRPDATERYEQTHGKHVPHRANAHAGLGALGSPDMLPRARGPSRSPHAKAWALSACPVLVLGYALCVLESNNTCFTIGSIGLLGILWTQGNPKLYSVYCRVREGEGGGKEYPPLPKCSERPG